MKNNIKNIFIGLNLFITVLMVVAFILLLVGCSMESDYLIYGSLGGIAIVYLIFALPFRLFESLIGEEKKWKK